MNNYMYVNSNLLINKLEKIKNLSITNTENNICDLCNSKFNQSYKYKINTNLNNNIQKNINNRYILFSDLDIHLYKYHNLIKIILYEQLSIIKIDNYVINYYLLNINSILLIDDINKPQNHKIFVEKNKGIYESEILRYAEKYGYITFKSDKIDKIILLNKFRVDKTDPEIYQPQNYSEAFEVDYIFHTHPITPYIGSRIKIDMLYEFPSISDILHFKDHHNFGILKGSIVITPEGLYIIRKYNFNKNKIILDEELFKNEMKKIYYECYDESMEYYSKYNLYDYVINDDYSIPYDIFYNNIANNYFYINKINSKLIKYNLFIDFYSRIKYTDINVWGIPNIYIPIHY